MHTVKDKGHFLYQRKCPFRILLPREIQPIILSSSLIMFTAVSSSKTAIFLAGHVHFCKWEICLPTQHFPQSNFSPEKMYIYVRFEIFTPMNIKTAIERRIHGYQILRGNWSRWVLQNLCNYLPDYSTSHVRRPQSEYHYGIYIAVL
jgi:hypothetical protein